MNLAQFTIEKNRIALTLLGTMVVLGLSLYQSLARDSMPPFTIRVAAVVSSFPGASPERVEALVTDPIEKIAQELPELKEVTSTSRTGLSIVSVTLKDEVGPESLQAVWDRLRRKLESYRGLPEGVGPRLEDDGIGDVYGIVLGLTSDGFSYAEMREYADDLRDELIALDSAAKVELGGTQEERIFIEFSNTRLSEYGLSAARLQSIVGSVNILSTGGEVNIKDERIVLEPTGNFENVDAIRRLLVPVGQGGQLVQLGDITTVRRGYLDPPEQLVRVNGRDAITLHVNLKSGANIITLGEEVDALIASSQAVLPVGLELSRVASLDTYINVKISNFMMNLIQAIAIVLLVMLVFLGLRTGFVIASLIPLVTIMTLMLMGVLNLGLNQVTLAALIMALGMMVDNAIVVAESIMVRIEAGVERKKAAVDSCAELFTPLLISTLTTSAAFLAFYLAESSMGDIVGPIFVVISLALLSSWLIALSIISFFCYLFLKEKPAGAKLGLVDRAILFLKHQYKVAILRALSHKTLVVTGVLLAFVLSLFGFGFVPFVFFPDSDRNTITVDVNLPLGTRIERTNAVVSGIEQFIADSLRVNDQRSVGVTSWSSYVGQGPESYDMGYNSDEPNASYAHVLINTSHFLDNVQMIERLDRFCLSAFPDADIKVGPLAAGGGGIPVEVKVSGQNPDVLAQISEKVRQKLVTISGTKNVKDDWGPKSKKFVIDVDQSRAQAAGVSSQDIATSLQTVLTGFQTGEYREDDKTIAIMLRSDAGQQQSLESLSSLNVLAQNSGTSVPLLQVADIVPEWQYSKIRRLNLRRTINVSSELTSLGNASAITAELRTWIEEESKSWPAGYTYKFYGDAYNTAENMGAVIKYLPLSGFIILLLLIIQFNSYRKMVMVVLTIPLGVIGVVVGLLLFREPFGFMPFLGLISLAGIVINNAIVLLDRINIEQENRDSRDAVVVACLQRFRPIVLATSTTILGLVPLYLSGGEMWEGMAVSIMVGLLFGTVITLVFIPSLFSIFYRLDYKGYQFNDSDADQV